MINFLWQKHCEVWGAHDKCFISGGGSSGSSDTSFARTGTSVSQRQKSIPTFLTDLLTKKATSAAVPDSMTTSQNSFLSGLLGQTADNVPGKSVWDSLKGIDPESYTGKATLTQTATQDPYSDNYEANTEAKFRDTVDNALSRVQTGPDNVRGGQARTALTKGDAIERMSLDRATDLRRAQTETATLATSAAQVMAAIEQGRRAIISGAQGDWIKAYLGGQQQGLEANRAIDSRRGVDSANIALATNEMSSESSSTTDNLSGKGSQGSSGSHVEGGITGCCFIFLEALNGTLPWYVRKGRDMFQTPERRNGYIRMSKWLVPLMQRSKLARWVVNFIMIKPFLKMGAWFFGDESAQPHWKFYGMYCQCWFNLWSFIGR
jgi:hypothetical protein